MVIIVVKYMQATDTRGSQFQARCVIGDTKYRAVLGYDHSKCFAGNNRAAALKLCNDLMLDVLSISAKSADLPGGGVGFSYTGEV